MKKIFPLTVIASSLISSALAFAAAPRPGTIGTLPERIEVQSDDDYKTTRDVRDEQQTLKDYEHYLSQQASDAQLTAEAKRRIADLDLETADLLLAAGGDDSMRMASYKKAIQIYEDLLKENPDSSDNDQLLYQLSRAQDGSGQSLDALATLDQLTQKYPSSPFLVEAMFRRGELLFAHGQYPDADAAYAFVLSKGQDGSSFFEPALYKQGWSRLKQDHYPESMPPLFQLLEGRLGSVSAQDVSANLDKRPRAERELLDDTFRAIALGIGGMGKEHTVTEVLRKFGDPGYGYQIYTSLAAELLLKERYSDAANVDMQYVDAHPDSPQAPGMQSAAVSALESGSLNQRAIELQANFVHRFESAEPSWQLSSAPELVEADKYYRESVWKLAAWNHAASQVTGKEQSERNLAQADAIWLYRKFIASFGTDSRAPQAAFLLGDVLLDSGKPKEAVEAYEIAAYKYPGFARRQEAAYASLQVGQKQSEKLSGRDKDEWKTRSIQANLRFANTFRSTPEGQLIRANAAAALYAAGDLSPAIQNAQDVVNSPNISIEAKRIALGVLGHAKFDQKDFSGSETAYSELQRIQVGDKKSSETADLLAASIYKQGEQAEKSGQMSAAAAAFSRVATVAPSGKIRAAADYDAAMALYKDGKVDQAIPLLNGFRTAHPEDPLAAEATKTLSLVYEKAGKSAEAAHEFERISEFSTLSPDEKRSALWHSYQLYKDAKSPEARRILTAYINRYPTPFADAVEAYQAVIDDATEKNNDDEVQSWSAKLVTFEKNGGAGRTDRTKGLAARASLVAAHVARDSYKAAPLKQPIASTLAQKRQKLEAAISAYANASDYGASEVVTESTFEMADLYRDLANELRNLPAPKKLDAEAREQYSMLMDEQIVPIEDKAIEIHQANARRASQGIYDAWVKNSFAALAELSPGRYNKAELPMNIAVTLPQGLDLPAAQSFQASWRALNAGQLSEAIAGFSKLSVDHPEIASVSVCLAQAYHRSKSAADEEKVLRAAARKWPSNPQVQIQFAQWARDHGQFDLADAAYQNAIAADARNTALHFNRGVLNDLYRQRPLIAADEFEKYQGLLKSPDPKVGQWINDLRKRGGNVVSTAAGVNKP